jgi:hypothetical protein
MKVEYGHFLSSADEYKSFDTSMFAMSKRELENADPQLRILLEVVWECLENAGEAHYQGEATGCFVGVWASVRKIVLGTLNYANSVLGLGRHPLEVVTGHDFCERRSRNPTFKPCLL